MSQRRPDFNEREVMALRLLSFEEPASRFARTLKLLGRYPIVDELAGDGASRASDSNRTTALSLRKCHALFGPDRGRFSASEALALALALDDQRLFSSTAMLGWYGRYWSRLDGQDLASLRFDDIREDILNRLASGLSREGQAWLRAALWTAFDLEALAGSLQDKLTAMIRHCGKTLHPHSGHLTASQSSCEDPAEFNVTRAVDQVYLLSRSLIGKYRPELVLLVEGQTEAIVLPHVASLLGVEQAALEVVASGGAQQVVRRYLTLKDSVRLPIVCVLDGDAAVSAELIEDSLRPRDYLVSLAVQELEDAYGYEQLLEMLNKYLNNHGQTLSQSDFALPRSGARKEALKKMLRQRGLGDLDKIEFAHAAVACLHRSEQVPAELVRVIETVVTALRDARGDALETR